MNNFIQKHDGKWHTLREYLSVIFIWSFLIGLIIYHIARIGDYEEIYLSYNFDAEVIDVFPHKSSLYIQISGWENKLEISDSWNYDYAEEEGISLSKIMEVGDRVIKNECSDTIFVVKNDKEYHFLIGDHHYNNPDKPEVFIQKWRVRRKIVTSNNDCN